MEEPKKGKGGMKMNQVGGCVGKQREEGEKGIVQCRQVVGQSALFTEPYT